MLRVRDAGRSKGWSPISAERGDRCAGRLGGPLLFSTARWTRRFRVCVDNIGAPPDGATITAIRHRRRDRVIMANVRYWP